MIGILGASTSEITVNGTVNGTDNGEGAESCEM